MAMTRVLIAVFMCFPCFPPTQFFSWCLHICLWCPLHAAASCTSPAVFKLCLFLCLQIVPSTCVVHTLGHSCESQYVLCPLLLSLWWLLFSCVQDFHCCPHCPHYLRQDYLPPSHSLAASPHPGLCLTDKTYQATSSAPFHICINFWNELS